MRRKVKPAPGKVREERWRNEGRTEASRMEVRMFTTFVYPSDTVLIRLRTLGFVAMVGLRIGQEL